MRAGSHGFRPAVDPQRGRADSQALADAFLQRNIVVDAIAVSPLVRAHQTAVEFVSVLARYVVTCDELPHGKSSRGSSRSPGEPPFSW